MTIEEQIKRRRTFAIISHPDAGKTTLTEKLLLFGGAIQTAGAVKSNKIKKGATSDFMEIERQRGISVATSVMAFEYQGVLVNLLDTPGHKDFAEDTYRTLTAVDSVILVIDCVKGVELQTKRLMEVCRMRDTPVIIFVNKLDRDGKDPFDLLDELEEKLDIQVHPLSWPISMGQTFKGVYNLYDKSLHLFSPSKQTLNNKSYTIEDIYKSDIEKHIETHHARQLREDVELIEGIYDPLDISEYLQARIAPVFFGSAINNFGVKELLETFIKIAPSPLPRETSTVRIYPTDKKFSGFIFKIHANLDPKHRDRIAFMRVCSGVFERNSFYVHTRLNKKMKFSNPTSFMAQSKQVIDKAYPGDVIGLYDTGNFKIGDTLSQGELFSYKGIPNFSPEIFKELINTDPMKSKQLNKGISQLTDEGVAQLFTRQPGSKIIIGTVGELQFEVIKYRLLHEYGASCDFHTVSAYKACWIASDDEASIGRLKKFKSNNLYTDKDNNTVYLAESSWMLDSVRKDYPNISFLFTSEMQEVV